jgi:hypothetical protein
MGFGGEHKQRLLTCALACVFQERLFLEVAHALGKKVYVSKDKHQILQVWLVVTSTSTSISCCAHQH